MDELQRLQRRVHELELLLAQAGTNSDKPSQKPPSPEIKTVSTTEPSDLVNKLAESDARFQGLLQDLQVGVVIEQPGGRVLFCNPSAAELLGLSQQEILGLEAFDKSWNAIHEDGSNIPLDTFPGFQAAQTGVAVRNVVMGIYRPRTEDRVWLLVNSEPQLMPDGSVRQVITTFSDITSRKQTEDARTRLSFEQLARKEAEEARHKVTFLAQSSKLLAHSLDYELTLQSVAQAVVPDLADWCTVHILDDTGFPRQVALSHVDPAKVQWANDVIKTFEDRYPYDPNAPAGLANVIRTAQPELYTDIPDAMLVALVPDQELLQMMRMIGYSSAMVVPMVARGRVLGVLQFTATNESGRHYNQTDLELALELAQRAATAVDNARLYRDAQQAIQMRDEFLSIAAHELKTPVTSLRGYAQLISRQLARGEVPPLDRLNRAMDVVDQQSGKLAHLITQLLDISRLEMGQFSLVRELVDLKGLTEQVIENMKITTSKHTFTLNSPAVTLVWADPARLEQVLINLIGNAIKYSPNGGPVHIDITAPPGQLSLSLQVTDQGIGVPAEHRNHIFERFYKAHENDRTAGVGLGLYISRQIVELHGGTVEAEFPPEGGTRLIVNLPSPPEPQK